MEKTFYLSISTPGLDCADVAKFMQQQKIACSVSPNISVQCDKQKNVCEVENGCRIIFAESQERKHNLSELWFKMKNQFGFDCAHLKTHSNYEGCVYDFVRETNCPGNQ